jgi:hypothetical protein
MVGGQTHMCPLWDAQPGELVSSVPTQSTEEGEQMLVAQKCTKLNPSGQHPEKEMDTFLLPYVGGSSVSASWWCGCLSEHTDFLGESEERLRLWEGQRLGTQGTEISRQLFQRAPAGIR